MCTFWKFQLKFFWGKISFCNILDARQTTLYAKHVTTNYIWQLKYTSNLIFRAIWMSGGLNATPTYNLKRTFLSGNGARQAFHLYQKIRHTIKMHITFWTISKYYFRLSISANKLFLFSSTGLVFYLKL